MLAAGDTSVSLLLLRHYRHHLMYYQMKMSFADKDNAMIVQRLSS